MDKIRRKNAQKVVVAMSGGVDSSVAAALLKRAGFEVRSVFMRIADGPSFGKAEAGARKVARKLGVPFSVVDLRKEFKKRIIDSFLRNHRKGKTPNPCVECNPRIKFGLLFKKARTSRNDFFATGHYARIVEDSPQQFKLLKGRDKEKDQSYFLWQLGQRQLKRTIFPVGNYTKKEVRVLAKNFNLPVLEKKESQEICFVSGEVNNFLRKYLKLAPGKIISAQGKVLGKHQGLWFYTIGQRKGIRLAGGPYYVSGKDLRKNLLIVSKRKKDLEEREFTVKNINWLSGKSPKLPLKVKAKIRYRQKKAPATIRQAGRGKLKVVFSKPQRAITPGQSVVFYRGEELVAGGVIC